jgi:hypothetical protein
MKIMIEEDEDALFFDEMMSQRWSRWLFYLACFWSIFSTFGIIWLFIWG